MLYVLVLCMYILSLFLFLLALKTQNSLVFTCLWGSFKAILKLWIFFNVLLEPLNKKFHYVLSMDEKYIYASFRF